LQKALNFKKANEQYSEVLLKKTLGDDFKRKMSIFLTIRWQILKQFKQNLLHKNLKKATKRRSLQHFLARIELQKIVKKVWQILNHQRKVKIIISKILFKLKTYKDRFP